MLDAAVDEAAAEAGAPLEGVEGKPAVAGENGADEELGGGRHGAISRSAGQWYVDGTRQCSGGKVCVGRIAGYSQRMA
jgi:hypothetical protein